MAAYNRNSVKRQSAVVADLPLAFRLIMASSALLLGVVLIYGAVILHLGAMHKADHNMRSVFGFQHH